MSLSVLNTAEVLAGYTVKERIGAGGYGEVWTIEAPGGLLKAVKYVYGYLDGERAACELKALNRIKAVRHPFLLSLERIEVAQGQLLILTELADGSLRDRFEECLRNGQPGISREELLIYMHDTADALDYMSEQYSLQHLDVKPENLLLLGGRIKVADFGLVKDIDDRTVSVIGGLTPAYAAPEVLDGRPSLLSDQYSLAIVYQQMLTGQLPFPGRTPAQLAAQHLNARPRLGSLDPADREIIARALSKNPSDRFPSCRAMVELLQSPNQNHAAVVSASRPSSPSSSDGPRPSGPRPSGPRPSGPRPSGPRSSHVEKTLSLEAASHDSSVDSSANGPKHPDVPHPELAAPAASASASPQIVCPVGPAPATEALPPLDLSGQSARLWPTMWLGIGGLAAGVLRGIRARLNDRFAGEDVPSLRMLLIDTDVRALAAVSNSDSPSALKPDETLPMPLRRPQDYKGDRVKHLQWLSRRWLYNIPRTLQTEMLRPLGRLAMVDHGRQLVQRLQTILGGMVTPEAMATSAEVTGLEAGPLSPRVFVVASISGGTGSGMVLDVARAARHVLSGLKCPDPQVILVLVHAANRTPTQADLARVNSYACLSELFHERWLHTYPGETALGLPAAMNPDPALRHVYLLHLGDDLEERQFEPRMDTLSEYLYREAVTPAAAFFQQSRRIAEPLADDQPDLNLRTFGLCQIGASRSRLPETAAEELGRQIVQCWCGAPSVEEPIAQAGQNLIDKLALHAKGLQSCCNRVFESHVGRYPDDHLHQFIAELPHEPASIEKLVQTLDELLGSCSPNQTVCTKEGTLEPVLQEELAQRVEQQATEVVGWIMGLVEQPGTRLHGARHAAKQFSDLVRDLEKQFHHQKSEIDQAICALQSALKQACEPACYRRGLLGFGRPARRSAEVERLLLQYASLRWQRLMAAELGRFSSALRTRLSAVGDQLNDLSHALSLLAAEFKAAPPRKHDAPATEIPLGASDVPAELATALAELVPSLAQQMDRQLQAGLLARHGGLRGVLQRDGDLRRRVPPALRSLARAEVLRALKRLNMPGLLCEADQVDRLLETLHDAAPRLNGCGGARRLLLVVPRGSDPALPSSYEKAAEVPPTVVWDSDADLTVCFELEQLSLIHAASALIDHRSDYAEAARRMHTRLDIPWVVMPLVPGPEPAKQPKLEKVEALS